MRSHNLAHFKTISCLMRYIIIIYLWVTIGNSDVEEKKSKYDDKSSISKIEEYPDKLGARLSKDVLPQRYVIAISPDFQKNIFHGAIRIIFEMRKERNHVILHAKDLEIESTTIYRGNNDDKNSDACSIKSYSLIPEYEMIIVKLEKKMKPGIYTMGMNFSGRMDNRMNGFYLSTYSNRADYDNYTRTRKLAVTQFEPTYARKAFPCFDEPGFKSIFEVKIIHSISNGYHALSNMPALRVEKVAGENDLVITRFASSLPMSTYLVAFLVSDFTCTSSIVESLTGTAIPVSVCSSLSNKNKLRFALSVAIRLLHFYITYFQIDYPLPKIDLVGVPDFAAGAMENWGLVTFRETEILESEENSSIGNRKSVALTIAHELGHMWFGNLVTLEWWDDLWLNEGFATYMEHVAIDIIFPEWRQMDYFPLETKYLTMRSDSKITAHPIIRTTENPDEIGQMFDHISYQKGAAVIKMLEDVMGGGKFIKGIREYLLKYKFGNAASEQLLEILQKHSGGGRVNLMSFLNTWTKLAGFPVVNVHRDSSSSIRYKVFQRRFVSRGMIVDNNATWDLPIKYVTSRREDGVKLVWLLRNAPCGELSLENPVDWIKLNHRSIGYYIVNYSEDMWNSFSELLQLDTQALDPLDRADLLHNSFTLADSNNLRYSFALNITRYLGNETFFQPWVVAASWILRVDRLFSGMEVHRSFRRYARYLIQHMYYKVGWDIDKSDNFHDRELRMLVLRIACSLGHKHCLRTGEAKLKLFIDTDGFIRPPADLRPIIYSFGLVRPGSRNFENYEKLWKLFIQENDPQEKERLLIGLADAREPQIIMRYLERVADENLVRRQNFFEAIGKVASNPIGLDMVWNFLRNNWNSLVKKYTLNDAAMGSLVGKIISSFKDERRLSEAQEFFNRYPEAGAGLNARELALEEATSNIEWLQKNPHSINRWLKSIGF